MKHLLVPVLCVIGACEVAWCSDNDNSWRLNTDDTAIVVAVQQGIPVVTQLGSAKGESN